VRGLRRAWRGLAAVTLLALVTPPAWSQAVCEATAHGMQAGDSDNTAGLTQALSECAGQIVHIAHGRYLLSPQGFVNGLSLSAGTSIVGDGAQGPQATVLQVANSGNYAALLWVRNVSRVTIRNIRFEGSAYENGCTRNLDYGHAIYVQSDSGQPSGVDSVEISGNVFHNFNGHSWITVNAADGSPGIGLHGPITIANNDFDSDAQLSGGCIATGGMGYLAAMISIHGSDLSSQGMVENVTVTSNKLSAGYVKEGITVWSGTRNISVTSNVVADTGARLERGASPELGRYAILVYHSAHERPGPQPNTVSITDNTITNPVSCGIYAAGGENLTITANRISGQSDHYDLTLPKGAIALNHATNVTVDGNELSGNYFGISSVGTGALQLGDNRIAAAPGGIARKIR
jgi:Right handed beta helix region